MQSRKTLLLELARFSSRHPFAASGISFSRTALPVFSCASCTITEPSRNFVCTILWSCPITSTCYSQSTVKSPLSGPCNSSREDLHSGRGGNSDFVHRSGKRASRRYVSSMQTHSCERANTFRNNPVARDLAVEAEQYPFSSVHPGFELDPAPQGLKPIPSSSLIGTAKAMP